MKNIYSIFPLIFLFSIIANSSFSQKLNCRKRVITKISPYTCTAKLVPANFDSLSIGFDKLILEKDEYEIGNFTSKLLGVKDGKIVDSCESKLIIKTHVDLSICVLSSGYKIYMKSKAPLKIDPFLIGVDQYTSNCYDQEITVTPSYFYCTDPIENNVKMRITDIDGRNWQETWTTVILIRDAKDICETTPDFPDGIDNSGFNGEHSIISSAQSTSDEILKQEIFDLYGRLLNSSHRQEKFTLQTSGIYLVKSYYSSGKEKINKVYFGSN